MFIELFFLLENYEKIFLFSEAFLPGLVVALRGKSRLEVRGDGRTGLASGERYVSLFIGSIRMGKGKKEENFCFAKNRNLINQIN